jgi:uncharacterized protein (TIGR02145 family)
MTGLTFGTNYYVRAYATNSVGTAYGNQLSFFTVSPAILPSVTICTQIWAFKNLDVTTYSDGTPIPLVTDPTAWSNLTTGAFCYYNNDPANDAVYGKLYNWYAAAGIYNAASLANPALRKNLAPTGWHVPTDAEWSTLINCLDPSADGGNISPNIAGGAMKETGTTHWASPNTGATNSSGFTGLPGGYRYIDGTFNNTSNNYSISKFSFWWSSSQDITGYAWSRYLFYQTGDANRSTTSNTNGFSVRCLKD